MPINYKTTGDTYKHVRLTLFDNLILQRTKLSKKFDFQNLFTLRLLFSNLHYYYNEKCSNLEPHWDALSC